MQGSISLSLQFSVDCNLISKLSLVIVLQKNPSNGLGPYFIYVSMFLSFFDKLSTLVSMFTK